METTLANPCSCGSPDDTIYLAYWDYTTPSEIDITVKTKAGPFSSNDQFHLSWPRRIIERFKSSYRILFKGEADYSMTCIVTEEHINSLYNWLTKVQIEMNKRRVNNV